MVEMLQQHQAPLEPHHRLAGHELHQLGDALRRSPLARRDPEPLTFLFGQVDAPHPVILRDVPQHVGELQGHAQVVGELSGRPPGL